jgi:hypothetical protein
MSDAVSSIEVTDVRKDKKVDARWAISTGGAVVGFYENEDEVLTKIFELMRGINEQYGDSVSISGNDEEKDKQDSRRDKYGKLYRHKCQFCGIDFSSHDPDTNWCGCDRSWAR